MQNHIKRNGKPKEKVIKYLIKESWSDHFQMDKWLERWGLEKALKATGTLVFLWMEIGLSS